MSRPLPWPILDERPALSTRVFDVHQVRARSPRTDREHKFVRLVAPDWLNVIPLTDDGQVIMVRQFRHGTREVTLEIPGGMVDPGESPEDAAARELREETGYVCDHLQEIGRVHPNPALFDNTCYSYLARSTRRVGEITPDGSEDLGLELHPLADIPRLIREGAITHALVIAAFHWLELSRTEAPR